VVLNETSRFHIAMDALRRARRPPPNAAELTEACRRALDEHRAYVVTHFEDLPEIRDWTWPG
jgi:xylulose-5-phosphate/fructose-6-phosphate phosphoketolase